MARARKPTNVHELTGAFKKNPKRKREREGEPVITDPLGSPPEYLSEAAKGIWAEVVDECADGVLNRSHNKIMEELSIAVEYVRASYDAMPGDDVVEPCDPKWFVRIEKCLSLLGMTPADASRVSVPKPSKGESRFD